MSMIYRNTDKINDFSEPNVYLATYQFENFQFSEQ